MERLDNIGLVCGDLRCVREFSFYEVMHKVRRQKPKPPILRGFYHEQQVVF